MNAIQVPVRGHSYLAFMIRFLNVPQESTTAQAAR